MKEKEKRLKEALRNINNTNISLRESFVLESAALLFANPDFFMNPQTSIQVKAKGIDPTEAYIVFTNVLVIPSERGTLMIHSGNNNQNKKGGNNE